MPPPISCQKSTPIRASAPDKKRHPTSHGAGVMQGLTPPLWIVNASITSSPSATIWNVCPPKVTVSIVLPMGRAWLSSSVSTVASWILIIVCCLVVVVSCMLVLYQVIGTMSSPILGLDLAPPLPLEAASHPQPHHCHCCYHADCE